MTPPRGKRLFLVLASLVFIASMGEAQIIVPDSKQPVTGKKAPEAMDKALALPVAGKSKLVIEVIPSAAMSAEDEQIFASTRQEIRRRAASELMPLGQAGWSIEQVACPAFPHWLLLRYTHGSTPATRSLFSAAVNRQQHQVRLIPVSRKGYSAFGSGSGNPMAIGTLNTMLESEDPKPPLSQIALCYAALSGAAAQTSDGDKLFIAPAEPPIARVEPTGEESVTIMPREIPEPSLSLDFDSHGKLVKVSRMPSGVKVQKPARMPKELQQVRPVLPSKQK